MIGPLSEFLTKVAAFSKANTIELMKVDIQRKLIAHFFRSLRDADRHSEQIIVVLRVV